ncbi:MAG: rod shape-determining protein [Christensenellales bacterium]|nr:hypothetical protein [Clostridiales bacterium]
MAAINLLGIDFGASYVRIYDPDSGNMYIEEPAVMALNIDGDVAPEVGTRAYHMLGREPMGLEVIRPIINGSVPRMEVFRALLIYFFKTALNQGKGLFKRPRVLISVSWRPTVMEERQIVRSLLEAGARRVQLIARPLAAAVGAGVDVLGQRARLVIDIGADSSHPAVISRGRVQDIRGIEPFFGGDGFSKAIYDYVKTTKAVLGPQTLELIKKDYGTMVDGEEAVQVVRGQNPLTGMPVEITLSKTELDEALTPAIDLFVQEVKSMIQTVVAPEIASDIYENGLLLTGGGAHLDLIAREISERLKLECQVPTNAEACVAIGCGRILQNLDRFNPLLTSSKQKRG